MYLCVIMKADPINLITQDNKFLEKKFNFITGNEVTLMEKIKDVLIYKNISNNSMKVEKIKNIDQANGGVGLFEDKKIYIVEQLEKIDKEKIENFSNNENIYIFISENSPKTRTIKNIFSNRDDSYLIECYELSQDLKGRVLNWWLRKKNLKLDNDLYWFLIEKLDNRYYLLEKELEKILKLDKEKITRETIEKLVSKKTTGPEKIFFEILNNNQKLIDIYNERITNPTELNDFFYRFRFFCFLIINSKNEADFNKNIPVYLFKEKGFLVSLFKKYNDKKKKILLKLLFKTEKEIRKNNSLILVVGLRFLLSFRKITIS